ncbi:hypothetical protein, partial [Corynebacterium parakroppenstedtii]|uniref:hypothetical protein n=1 Tax=Corynebacterium parakroppenstedtii TaxID=2828363 RepID=UPI001C8D70F3
VKHAASVRPEPGSNSPYKQSTKSLKTKQKTNPDTKTKSCIRIHKKQMLQPTNGAGRPQPHHKKLR